MASSPSSSAPASSWLPVSSSPVRSRSGENALTHADVDPVTRALGRVRGALLESHRVLGQRERVTQRVRRARPRRTRRCRSPPGAEISPGASLKIAPRSTDSVRPRRAPCPLVAPPGQLAEDRHQLARPRRELVVHARRNLAVALAGEHAVGDHPVQPRAELLGRDPGKDPLELDEPAWTGGEIADDQKRPFVADKVERPGVRRPLIVGMAFRWGYVRNGMSSRWTVRTYQVRV